MKGSVSFSREVDGKYGTVSVEVEAETVEGLRAIIDQILAMDPPGIVVPEPPTEPPLPPLVEEGYLDLELVGTAGPPGEVFQVNIVGGTTTPVDGYSTAVGYKAELECVGFTPAPFIVDYVAPNTPFLVVQIHPAGTPGAVPGPHVGVMVGLWSTGTNVAPPPLTIPPNTVLGTLVFRPSTSGVYVLDHTSRKWGKRPIAIMYTRVDPPHLVPELDNCVVEVA